MNKVIWNSLFGLIGILVVWQLYYVFASVLGKLLLFAGLLNKTIFLVGVGISIIVIIWGFVIGVKAADKKKLFYTIFKPNNENMLAALLLSILLIVYSSLTKGLGLHSFFVITILVKAIIFYPFAALALYAYNNWDRNPIKQYKTLIVVILVLLSPVALAIGSSNSSKFSHSSKNSYYNKFSHDTNYLQYNKFSHSSKFPYHNKLSYGSKTLDSANACGAYAYGFPENSPAEEAGMQVGEIIKEINGIEIKTLNDIKDITYPLTEETEITIKTDKGTYEVTTYYDEVKEKQRFGVNVWQQTCNSTFKSGFKKLRYK